jgi:AcrR family transcriptional regulator
VHRGLTRADVVQAGLDVLDELGLDGLTVRSVATRLGVKPPALYWHVHSKQDLFDEMATEVWRRVNAELTELPVDLPWQQAMTDFALITRRALLAHRDGAKVFSGTYLTDAGLLEHQEAGLRRMVGEGFALPDVIRGWRLLYSFTIGFCIEEQAVAQSSDERYSLTHRSARIDSTTHPLVVESGPLLFSDPDGRFAEVVAVIIDALARLRRR